MLGTKMESSFRHDRVRKAHSKPNVNVARSRVENKVDPGLTISGMKIAAWSKTENKIIDFSIYYLFFQN